MRRSRLDPVQAVVGEVLGAVGILAVGDLEHVAVVGGADVEVVGHDLVLVRLPARADAFDCKCCFPISASHSFVFGGRILGRR